MKEAHKNHARRFPLALHGVRLLATLAVAGAFRWKRPTRLRLFRALMGFIFGRLAPRYETLWGRLPGGWEALTIPLREALSDPLIGPPPKRLLDMACGTARASRLAAERYTDATFVALDLTQSMLQEARALWGGHERALHLVAGDAASPPFKAGSFDLVVVMNGPPEPEAVRELLAPGGRAVFAYSLPYTPVIRPRVRRRLEEAGFAHVTVRPSGLGMLVIARREDGSAATD